MMAPNRALLAKIHIAKKELGFDDETYRDILQTRYKKDSAAKLSRFEAEDLIEHFKKQGFRVKKAAGKRPQGEGKGKPFAFKSSPTYEKPMARKVVAMWINMALDGVVSNGSDAALQAYVKRMTGKDNLAWCNGKELFMLIEALKKWMERGPVK